MFRSVGWYLSDSAISVSFRLLSKLVVHLAACAGMFWIGICQAAVNVDAARVWPAPDYTRVTLESDAPISYKSFLITDPSRLVIDLEDVNLTKPLESLTGLIDSADPYIKAVRIARYKPGIVRIVLDLKTEVKPNVFALKPYAQYGHRLVMDIYPSDPLMALLDTPRDSLPKTTDPKQDGARDIATIKPELGPNIPDKTLLEKPLDKSEIKIPGADGSKEPRAADGVGMDKAIAPAIPQRKAPMGFEKRIVVAIDAGHGGEDSGALGSNGTMEKDVTLAIARVLKGMVDQEPEMQAVLIRDGDYFIPLHGRVTKTRKHKADLFISIHADAFIKPHARGSSVFALSETGATSAAARWLAKQENESDLVGGVSLAMKDPYLARTLLDLSQTAMINDSLKLGKEVLTEMGEVNTLHKGMVEQAGFAVLKSPDTPSILVETAFISNPEEERKLTDATHQQKIANAILSGIKRYFAKNPIAAKPKLVQR